MRDNDKVRLTEEKISPIVKCAKIAMHTTYLTFFYFYVIDSYWEIRGDDTHIPVYSDSQ